MFRLIHSGNSLPTSFACDPSASFQAGMIAELVVLGNQVVATVSNGTAPIGIIDDYKTKAFTNVSWNEIIIVPATGIPNGSGQLVTPIDILATLKKPSIIPSSFFSEVNVALNSNNGIITFVAGTPLNFDMDGDGVVDSIRTVVNYSYYVANIPGDDSTQGSGRVTVWYQRMFFDTDQYETNQNYPVRANVFVSEIGLLTTRKPSAISPAVGMVVSPPSIISSMLSVMWY